MAHYGLRDRWIGAKANYASPINGFGGAKTVKRPKTLTNGTEHLAKSSMKENFVIMLEQLACEPMFTTENQWVFFIECEV